MTMFRRFALAAAVAALLAPPAFGVELAGRTRQVNDPDTRPLTLWSWTIADRSDGGFSVLWAQGSVGTFVARDLYVRHYDAEPRPLGPAASFGGRVDGTRPDRVRVLGGLNLGRKQMFVWDAQYDDNPTTPSNALVGRLYRDGVALGPVATIDTVGGDVGGGDVVALGDGKGVVTYGFWGTPNHSVGRLVLANGALGPEFAPAPSTYRAIAALRKGFVTAYEQSDGGARTEVRARVFDASANQQRDFKLFSHKDPTVSIGLVGLASGDFVLLRRVGEQDDHKIRGQRFTRAGKALGEEVTLLGGPPNFDFPVAVTLPDGGFLLVAQEGAFDARKLVFRRFDDDLRKAGPNAETETIDGLARGAVRRLADGRVATQFVVDGAAIYVQLVQP